MGKSCLSGISANFLFFQPRLFQGVPDVVLFGSLQPRPVFLPILPVHSVQKNSLVMSSAPGFAPGVHGLAAEVAAPGAVFPDLRNFQRGNLQKGPWQIESASHILGQMPFLLLHQRTGEGEKMDIRRRQGLPGRPGKAGTIHSSREKHRDPPEISKHLEKFRELRIFRKRGTGFYFSAIVVLLHEIRTPQGLKGR